MDIGGIIIKGWLPYLIALAHGINVISDLALYDIGTFKYSGKVTLSYFLGSLTIAVGFLCLRLFFISSPSEVT
ncbi:hypothetical protein EDD18DRAFT_1216093 [Armillaria luteobubalina]|uniref:Uncharacterized protein n=1 Tax=Armillaria luteobubalina TaxID=153913 RepID=A0AA39P2B7_9AGAR|nr:hypothetical protein EDD18DRAFT_1216093 [Armillaria luteobubalina]